MSDCCTPGTGFPNNGLMAQLALNHPTIWAEICMIQQAILAAASQCQPAGGQMCTTVGGNTPMTFISGIESITVVNGGLDYFADVPAISFVPPVGAIPGSIATATLITNGGNILGVTVTDGGTGYQPVPSTISVTSVLGLGAVIDPLVNAAGQIVNANILNAGTGYTVNDTVTATRAILPNIAFVDAVFVITSVGILGEIVSIAILNPGSGYEPSVTTVEIVSTLNPLLPYPLGGGFNGTVLTDPLGVITGVIINNVGAGYSDFLPYLVITDPGTGALTTVTLNGTSVESIAVDEPGIEYTISATGIVLNPITAPAPNPPATPAVVTVNVAVNTFGTNPYLYWQVWSEAATNKQIQMQLNSVISYFKGLGYTITIQTNPSTGSTIQWRICW